MVRELFAADVEGIEDVGAVGAMFEQVLRLTLAASRKERGNIKVEFIEVGLNIL